MVRLSAIQILLVAGVMLVCEEISPNVATADNLAFRRSYYSHDVPPELQHAYPQPESRSAYRPALRGTTPGFAIRGGYRFNRMFLRSGNSTDTTIFREDWFDVRP